ncbi:MAG: LamG domain-containing protein [Candidatus Micrarchaeota archaeon]
MKRTVIMWSSPSCAVTVKSVLVVLLLCNIAFPTQTTMFKFNIDEYVEYPVDEAVDNVKLESSAKFLDKQSGFTASYEKGTACSSVGVCETQILIKNEAGQIHDFEVEFHHQFSGDARGITLWQSYFSNSLVSVVEEDGKIVRRQQNVYRWIPVDPGHFSFRERTNRSFMLRYNVTPCSNGTWNMTVYSPYGSLILGGRYASVCAAEKLTKVEDALGRGESWDDVLNPDGSTSRIIYATPVNWWNGEEYVPIDKTLISIGRTEGMYADDYRLVGEGDYNTYFKSEVNDDWPVLAVAGGNELKMRPFGIAYHDGEQYRYIQVASDSVGIPNRNSVVYGDVFTGVDVEYYYQEGLLKEKLMLKEEFKTLVSGLALNEDAEIYFVSQIDYRGLEPSVGVGEKSKEWIDFVSGDGSVAYSFAPADARDSAKALVDGEEVGYPDVIELDAELTERAGKGYYAVSVPLYWLERSVYPIVIDPTAHFNGSSGYCLEDNYIQNSTDWKVATQIKWDMSAINLWGSTISDVQLCFWNFMTAETVDDDANFSRVANQTWTESTVAEEFEDMPLTDENTSQVFSTNETDDWWCINVTQPFLTDFNAGNANLSIRIEDPDYPFLGGDGRTSSPLYIGDMLAPSNYIGWRECDYSTQSQRPYMNVTYTGPGCGTITGDTTLQSDLVTTGDCFTIGANGITLDCQGYTIFGDAGNGDYGIIVPSTRDSITIKNCVISGFQAGIYWSNADNSFVYNVTIMNSTMGNSGAAGATGYDAYGIYINTQYSDYNLFENITINEIHGGDGASGGTTTTGGLGGDGWGMDLIYARYSNFTNITIANISGGDGGIGGSDRGVAYNGGNGEIVYGIYTSSSSSNTLHNVSLSNITAGSGGNGGAALLGGTNGGLGDHAYIYTTGFTELYNINVDGVYGGDGGTGSGTGVGNNGGYAYGLYGSGTDYKNVSVRDVVGGAGGDGGSSIGAGGDGGDGRRAHGIYSTASNLDFKNTSVRDVMGGTGGSGGTGTPAGADGSDGDAWGWQAGHYAIIENFTIDNVTSGGSALASGFYTGGYDYWNVSNGSVTNAEDYEFWFTASSINHILLNASTDVAFSAGANASIKWYVRLNVTAIGGIPVNGAECNISDSTDRVEMSMNTTDADGLTGYVESAESDLGPGTEIPFNNHTINVSYSGTSSTTSFNVSDACYTINITLDVDLTEPSIVWEYPTPDNGSTVQVPTVYLNTTITDDSETSAFFDWNYSLLAYWPMDFYSASGIYDNSTNSNFGTFEGGLDTDDIVSGVRGNALYFDGGYSNDYVDIPNDILPDANEFSIIGWVYPLGENDVEVSAADEQLLVDLRGQYQTFVEWTEADFVDGIAHPEAIRFTTWNSVNSSVNIYSSDYSAPVNEWTHFAAVFNGTGLSLYVNGSLEATGTQGGAPDSIGGSESLLGKDYNLGSDRTWLNGSLDEIAIFSRALSAEEVLAAYNNSANRLQNEFTSLGEGTYDYFAYAMDAGGNLNITENRSVTVDLVDCGTITENSTLAQNLTTTGDCIVFDADDIYLDCNGYTIRGDGGTGDYGIDTDYHNRTTIRNCIVADFQVPIYVRYSYNTTINNNTLTYDAGGTGTYGRYGLWVLGYSGNNITNNVIHNLTSVASTTTAGGVYGIILSTGAGNNTIQYNIIANLSGGDGNVGGDYAGADVTGIYSTANNTIKENVVTNLVAGNGGIGLGGASPDQGGVGGDAYGIQLNAIYPANWIVRNNVSTITAGAGGKPGSHTDGGGLTGNDGGNAYGIYLKGGGNYNLENNVTNATGGDGSDGGDCSDLFCFGGVGGNGGEGYLLYALDGSNSIESDYLKEAIGGDRGLGGVGDLGGLAGCYGGAYGIYIESGTYDAYDNVTVDYITQLGSGACAIANLDYAYGIGFVGGGHNFTNSTVDHVEDYDIYPNGGQNSTFLNCSIDYNSIDWDTTTTENFTIKWYLQVNVTNISGDGISADVEVTDNFSVRRLSETVDAGGLSSIAIVNEKDVTQVTGSYNNYSYNVHTVNVTNGTSTNESTVNITTNTVVNVTLYAAAESECGTITEDATLINDIYSYGTTCITIGADDIMLDCSGHTITGNNTIYAYAIEAQGRQNVIIRNCRINNFSQSIVVNESQGVNVYNNTVYDSYFYANGVTYDVIGLYILDSNYTNVTNHTDWNFTMTAINPPSGGKARGIYMNAVDHLIITNYTGENHTGESDSGRSISSIGHGIDSLSLSNASIDTVNVTSMTGGYGIGILADPAIYMNISVQNLIANKTGTGLYLLCSANADGILVDNASSGGITAGRPHINVTNFNVTCAESTCIQSGVGVNEDNITLENGRIENFTYGIKFSSSGVQGLFKNITINDTTRGLDFGGGASENKFYNVTFDWSQYGVNFQSGNDENNFTDCIFYTSSVTTAMLYVGSGTNDNIFLNTTGNYSNVTFIATSDFLVQWYARVNVTDSGGTGIENVVVDITDINGNFGMQDNLTDSDGLTNYIVVNDTNYTSAGNTSFNNHTINASLGGYIANSTSFKMTNASQTINLTLYAIDCGVITQDTTLGADLTTTGDCIVFGADDITLNCMGYTIRGDGGEGDIGVDTNDTDGVFIRNCIVADFQHDVYINQSYNVTVDNNTLTYDAGGTGTYNRSGLYVDGYTGHNITSNIIHNITSVRATDTAGTAYGTYMNSSSNNNTLEYNVIVNITSGSGAAGGTNAGADVYAIYSIGNNTIKKNNITNIVGGNGGAGTTGATATAGGIGGVAYGMYINSATNWLIENNVSIVGGGDAGNAGDDTSGNGPSGVNGGDAYGIYLAGGSSYYNYNNVSRIASGNGGDGGNGAGALSSGGNGGDGGTAYGVYLGDGSNTGWNNNVTNVTSGDGGNGGDAVDLGGVGGDSGDVYLLYVVGGTNDVDSDYLSYAASGDDGAGGSGDVMGFNGCAGDSHGIYLTGASNNVFGNVTIDVVDVGSQVLCFPAGAMGDAYGIEFSGGAHNFTNTTVSNVNDYDLYPNDGQNSTFLNCSIDWASIDWDGTSTENFTIKWYLRVNVTNISGDGISADVNVTDIYSNSILSETIGAGGLSSVVAAGDVNVENTGGGQTNYSWNNHTVIASNATASNTTSVNITTNTVVNLTLYDPTCGTITQDTTLVSDLQSYGSTCITIGADDIMLDCGGHTITGNNTRYAYAIDTQGRQNILIRNCRINNFSTSIMVNVSLGVDIYNNTVYDSYLYADGYSDHSVGVYVLNSNYTNVTNHTDWNLSAEGAGATPNGGFGYGVSVNWGDHLIVRNYTGENHSGESDSGRSMLYRSYGIQLSGVSNFSGVDLNITNMSGSGYAIRVTSSSCKSNVSFENVIVQNGYGGTYFECPANVTGLSVDNASDYATSIDSVDVNLTNFNITCSGADCSYALFLDSNGTYENGRIMNVTRGIFVSPSGTGNLFKNITMNDTVYGVYTASGASNNRFYNITSDWANYSIYSSGGDACNFTDSVFYTSTVTSDVLYLPSGYTNTIFLNSTANYSNVTWTGTGDFLVQWYARVNVTNISGDAEENAYVNISDVNAVQMMVDIQTDSGGLTGYIIVNDTNYTDSGNIAFNNHTINVSLTGYVINSTSFNITGASHTINITLYEPVAADLSFTITLPSTGCTEGKGCTGGGCPVCTRAWIETTDLTGAADESCVDPEGQAGSIPFLNFTNTGNVALNWTMKLNESLSATFVLNITNGTDSCIDSTQMTDSFILVEGDIGVGGSASGWLYGEFISALYGNETREMNHTSEQS